VLADLLMDADAQQFRIIFPTLKRQPEQSLQILIDEIDHKPPSNADESTKENAAKRQANAAVALLEMNQPSKVWSLLKYSPDPRGRSYLIHRFSQLGSDAKAVLDRLDVETDLSTRTALILSLGEFSDQQLPANERNALIVKLQDSYRTIADPGFHAAAEWLLRTWGQDPWLRDVNAQWAGDPAQREQKLKEIAGTLTSERAETSRQWYVDGQGRTMVVIPGPVEFVMGSPPTESYREENETQHNERIGRTFAMADKPVTLDQYRQFDPQYGVLPVYRRMPELPVVAVSWYQAAAYCNWLSKQAHIPEEQWVYEVENGQVVKMKPSYLSLTGYRLPTEAELEYALRSGAVTSRYYGETESLLPKYAWYNNDSDDKTWPAGRKMPNDMGFFDLLGNVWTWSQDEYKPYSTATADQIIDDHEGDLIISPTVSRVLRGGSFNYEAKYLRSAYRYNYTPGNRNQHYGFRVVRTLNPGSLFPSTIGNAAPSPAAAGGSSVK
jgi:eukaryotic-like serine/threonine-protein kinase